MVCRAKNVLVKSTKSKIALLFASAQYEVNSKLWEVFCALRLPMRTDALVLAQAPDAPISRPPPVCSLMAENRVVLE